MKTAARIISLAALVATIAPPVLYFTGSVTFDSMRTWMLVATVVWFVATPIWLEK